jgi:hypothetical protein
MIDAILGTYKKKKLLFAYLKLNHWAITGCPVLYLAILGAKAELSMWPPGLLLFAQRCHWAWDLPGLHKYQKILDYP